MKAFIYTEYRESSNGKMEPMGETLINPQHIICGYQHPNLSEYIKLRTQILDIIIKANLHDIKNIINSTDD